MYRRIGVFDSGLGGLTVLDALLKALPPAEYIYLGDTARTPYGSKSQSTIIDYTREALAFFEYHQIDILVIACNTVSAVALETISKNAPFPIIGTIEPAIEACVGTATHGTVGVIGTSATVSSNAYQERLARVLPNTKVSAVACPLFVALVEDDITSGALVDLTIEHYLEPLRELKPDSVILGCTHYPLLLNPLKKFFGSQVTLIECSQAIAEKVAKQCALTAERKVPTSIVHYFVTDAVSRFNKLASKFLGNNEIAAIKIDTGQFRLKGTPMKACG